MEALTTCQQYFIQILVQHKVLHLHQLDAVHKVLAEAFSEEMAQFDSAKDVCHLCNTALQRAGLEIRGCKYEGAEYYALTPANATDLLTVQHASGLEQWQIDVVNKMLDEFAAQESNPEAHSDPRRMRQEKIKNLRPKGKTGEMMDVLLQKLLDDKWLVQTQNKGFVYLGPRTYVELQEQLRDRDMETNPLVV